MNCKKYTLSLTFVAVAIGLSGCESAPYQPPQISIGSDTYDWVKWDCFDFVYTSKHLLSVGYVPEIKNSKGVLFLKDSDSGINTQHSLEGVQHVWRWDLYYQIAIDSDGTGYFYDFSGAGIDEKVKPRELYKCRRR